MNNNLCFNSLFNCVEREIKVNFNLCNQQDIISWGYNIKNDCQNKYGIYYWGYDINKNLYGVENLFVPKYYINNCLSCSCDNILQLPSINLCSKLTIVLLTQDHIPTQDINGITYPGIQIGVTNASKILGNTNCYNELSKRAVYKIFKAVICQPLLCEQVVEFHLETIINSWDIFDTTMNWSDNENIFTDLPRVEKLILKYLD
jgi:hypothetical protein